MKLRILFIAALFAVQKIDVTALAVKNEEVAA